MARINGCKLGQQGKVADQCSLMAYGWIVDVAFSSSKDLKRKDVLASDAFSFFPLTASEKVKSFVLHDGRMSCDFDLFGRISGKMLGCSAHFLTLTDGWICCLHV
ncbi:hypothetical protein ACLOJK_041877 [Asimina triloba]